MKMKRMMLVVVVLDLEKLSVMMWQLKSVLSQFHVTRINPVSSCSVAGNSFYLKTNALTYFFGDRIEKLNCIEHGECNLWGVIKQFSKSGNYPKE